MKISELIKKGPLPYVHHCMQTMCGEATYEHVLDVPQTLTALAKSSPDSEVVSVGDVNLAIEIDGAHWATNAENNIYYHSNAKRLTAEVWQYLDLALGNDGDTYAN